MFKTRLCPVVVNKVLGAKSVGERRCPGYGDNAGSSCNWRWAPEFGYSCPPLGSNSSCSQAAKGGNCDFDGRAHSFLQNDSGSCAKSPSGSARTHVKQKEMRHVERAGSVHGLLPQVVRRSWEVAVRHLQRGASMPCGFAWLSH